MRRLYAYAFLEDLILLYPVYALLFAEHGLSAAEISTLFIIWSCVTFVLEVPSGMWADLFSRRKLLVLAPLLSGAGFALWTWLPVFVLHTGASSAFGSHSQVLVFVTLGLFGLAGCLLGGTCSSRSTLPGQSMPGGYCGPATTKRSSGACRATARTCRTPRGSPARRRAGTPAAG